MIVKLIYLTNLIKIFNQLVFLDFRKSINRLSFLV